MEIQLQEDRTTRVVWLHGAGLSSDTWAGRADGMCLDLPGHRAVPRATEPTVSAYADALVTRLPKSMCLVGHSLGGMVAMELAARHPERVKALVLAETAFRIRDTRRHELGADFALWLARRLGPEKTARLSTLGESRPTREAVRAQTGAMSHAGLMDALEAGTRFDGSRLLDRLTMPVLILVGRRNPRTHPQARIMADHLPEARLMTLKAGHMLHMDAPEKFYGTIRAFLKPHL